MEKYCFKDFTEDNYRKLLVLAKDKYKFIDYGRYRNQGRNILWRHDLDFSVHRARRLAQIEAEEGVNSTFFVNIHSDFYNALEPEIMDIIFEIIELGHNLGLHFDPIPYTRKIIDIFDLEPYLNLEKEILERIFKTSISALSFHNPEAANCLSVTQEVLCGMVNSYSEYLKLNYGYCSDSNGYWRFERLEDVLKSGKYEKLQVLTHDGWWVPQPASPRDRISRCIEGRAKAQHKRYDNLLKKYRRENVGAESVIEHEKDGWYSL